MNDNEKKIVEAAARILRRSTNANAWYAADQLELQILIGNPIYDAVSINFARDVIAAYIQSLKRVPDDATDLRDTQECARDVGLQ